MLNIRFVTKLTQLKFRGMWNRILMHILIFKSKTMKTSRNFIQSLIFLFLNIISKRSFLLITRFPHSRLIIPYLDGPYINYSRTSLWLSRYLYIYQNKTTEYNSLLFSCFVYDTCDFYLTC